MIDQTEMPLAAGFAEPVESAHAVFRGVMRAMARPGQIVEFPTTLGSELPLQASLAAIALALADFETPVWLDQPLRDDVNAVRYLRFHTGARFVERPETAAFALVTDPINMPPLEDFAQGTLEYPDRSTTLVLAVTSLEDGEPLQLSGPGIQGTTTIAPQPGPVHFKSQLQANRAKFPCGVDVIFATSSSLAALPRSVTVAP